ncbi:unnamed protein product [Adineta steineri]|uniref:Uncharacterized protein n=1 Tax=Adineta steineri TaxID=433720 RepID=A0A818MNF9_9BILA|nr:unnamed protein product [Adineta steineri]
MVTASTTTSSKRTTILPVGPTISVPILTTTSPSIPSDATTHEKTLVTFTTTTTTTEESIVLCATARWFPNGIVVAGGNGGGGAMNQLYKPESIAFDSQQNLYVSDPSFSRIQKYSRNSEEIVTLVISVKAGELFIDRYDNLYFTVSSSHTVQKRSAVGGSIEVVAGNGRYGAALNQLNAPKAVYVDREESVYVVDMNNQRIVKWLKKSTTGIMLFGGTGVLKNPVGLFVDEVNEVGAVYVCTHNSKVVKWMPNTQQLITVAGSDKAGNGIHQLLNPHMKPNSVIVNQLQSTSLP